MKPLKKVIVIGLDGLEPKIVKPMLDSGDLPNLARLWKQGGYSRVQTTYPAQTPVAWSTFLTGTNPGAHRHFKDNGVDLDKYPMSMGPLLKFDPKKEVFTNSAEANKILHREYRKPFVCPVPEKV